MATWKEKPVLGHLRALFNLGAIRELTDGQLLERFATERGEAAELAFAALVERHGPMVLRVCRGVLADAHDTQDAFQATFLVLVRRARALWVHDSLGPWLHQVAYRTALCARRAAARRRRHERSAATLKVERQPEPRWELDRALHEEIDRLPDHFRAPVVLCDLAGRTHEQAARHLGWPVGTVKSRLSRARDRLRDRLRRRGLGPETGAIAALTRPGDATTSIPAALLHSTTAASMQLATGRMFLHGSAAVLAQGVLTSMLITRWIKAASLVLVVGALTFGGSSAGEAQGDGTGPRGKAEAPRAGPAPSAPGEARTVDNAAVTRARPETLTVTVNERGVVESALSQDTFCLVEGGTSIIMIVPEGKKVTKGEVVCELDSAALKDQLTNQVIAASGARAAYQNAKLTREVAEIAVTEYENGVYKQQLAAVLGEIAHAKSDIRRAEARLERTREARRRMRDAMAARVATPVDVLAELDIENRLDDAEQAVAREKLALDLANTKHDVLMKFTRDKTTKELQSAVEKARSDELAKEQAWDLAKKKQAKLETQIKNCTLRAPADGLVFYANDPSRPGRGGGPQIEEGATVRERQKIFSLIDLRGPMRTTVKVPESMIGRVRPGMRARIKVDAFPNESLSGVVDEVAPLPDARFIPKVYTTRIKIDGRLPGLRPGLTADAEILVSKLDNVLSVPVSAVHRFDGKDYLAVAKPGGGFTWREVTLGESNGDRVEVKQGLRSGEDVVLDPHVVMEQGGLSPTAPATKPTHPR